MRTTARLVSITVVALLLAGCGKGSGEKGAGPPGSADSAVATVSAPDLWRHYGDNVLQADEKYKGKTIVVSGTADKIYADHVGLGVVGSTLVQADQYQLLSPQEKKWHNEGYPPNVLCYITEAEKPKFAKIKKDSVVRVKGTVRGTKKDDGVYMGYVVILDGCSLQP